MKFQPERLNYANSQRIQTINDSEFLTFRNSSQNTGRSIYSQQIQLKKNIQKHEHQSSSEQQLSTPVRSFKKKNNIRTTICTQQRSKSPLRSILPVKKSYQITNLRQNQSNQHNNNLESGTNQYQFKNQIIRKKIHKLIKNIKSQQRKQTTLQKQLQQLHQQIQQDQKQIQSQQNQIQQLLMIYEQNQNLLNVMIKNLQDCESKNHILQQSIEKIQDSLENINKKSITNNRQQDIMKIKTSQKLKLGLVTLEKLKNQTSNKCMRMEIEINKMKEYIEQAENVDAMIRDMTYSARDHSGNSSHFTL